MMTVDIARAALDLADESISLAELVGVDASEQRRALANLEFDYALEIHPANKRKESPYGKDIRN